MEILPSTLADLELIFRLYDEAIAFQKKVFGKHWHGFDRELIETEIREQRQWKLLVDRQVGGIFVVMFQDPLIWKEKENNDAIYLHRIVTNPALRGNSFVRAIVAWAKAYAKQQGRRVVRMDTWSDNQKLLDYYVRCGFSLVGTTSLAPTESLPKHYEGITLSLLELEIE